MSRPPPILSVSDLDKVYKVYARPIDRLLETFSRRPRHRAFEALRGVGFAVERGESLGLIGENGAGKSTLLKILSGVTAPSRGEVRVGGRVASLLELGMGFHPELSGRQNIRLNAAMMGFSAAEVAAKIPEIIDFAELGEFIDRPVKTYSSGMNMRLGFAIAVQVEPEILIIDEALSVGDGYFQKKCMDRIRVLLEGGCTFLFCSHAMYYVSTFCRRALWLRGGRIEALGPVEEVVHRYESFLSAKARQLPAQERQADPARTPARLKAVELLGGQEAGKRKPGAGLTVEVAWRSEDPELEFHLAVAVDRNDGVQVCTFSTRHDGRPALSGRQDYRMRLAVPELPMVRGAYELVVFLLDESALHVYDQRRLLDAFEIEPDDYEVALLKVAHGWEELS
jgi:ABC-type polysaccharide/polyol phosphate transport system ATPase subunit